MGRELQCRAQIAGKWIEGKALLETTEIIFRGDVRLKISFSALTTVAARNGQLRLVWDDNSAVLDLGEQAEKWAHAILHPKSTADKLGIKPGLIISAVRMPADTTMSDARKSAGVFADEKPLRDSDIIFLGATTTSDLARTGQLLPFLTPKGALWIVYPKGQKDITELQVLNAGRAARLKDIKVVSYSTTHTALKFARPKDKR